VGGASLASFTLNRSDNGVYAPEETTASIIRNIYKDSNLIKNGSFEKFDQCPQGLGDFFASSWSVVGKGSSPDLFSKCSPNQSSANPSSTWVRLEPYNSHSFAGIITYSKKKGYREYIGTKLKTKLVKDSTYVIRLAVSQPIMSRWEITEIGIHFSSKSILKQENTLLEVDSYLPIQLDTTSLINRWRILEIEYVANGSEVYLTIGNFRSDNKTVKKAIPNRKSSIYKKTHYYAYHCIDEVGVFLKYPSKIPHNKKTEKKSFEKFKNLGSGNSIILEDVIFLEDEYKFSTQSETTLNLLVEYLKSNISLKIIISGHTDNVGSEANNLELSKNRAKQVMLYLTKSGIGITRLKYFGYGSRIPVASNGIESGRQQNRRVEIKLQH